MGKAEKPKDNNRGAVADSAIKVIRVLSGRRFRVRWCPRVVLRQMRERQRSKNAPLPLLSYIDSIIVWRECYLAREASLMAKNAS